MENLLSFDVEEYFHGPAFGHIPPSQWPNLTPRLRENMEKLLSILDGQKATFFVLGWVAKVHPDMLREIQALGHEIACHGYMHRHIWDLSPREFSEDLLSAKQEIEDVIGTEVIGFRAPTFSVTRETLWALRLIRDAGFKYDSSIFPIRHDRYGISDFPRQPFQVMDGLWEIPLSTVRFWGINFPFGGGGYLRLYPYWLTRLCIRRINAENTPFVLYQHPWELDALKINEIARPKSVFAALRRSLGTGTPEGKLRKLLADFKFSSIRDYLEEKNARRK
jgi:polysaccharide deacetylase family protein (PEP-CTERM system associated)